MSRESRRDTGDVASHIARARGPRKGGWKRKGVRGREGERERGREGERERGRGKEGEGKREIEREREMLLVLTADNKRGREGERESEKEREGKRGGEREGEREGDTSRLHRSCRRGGARPRPPPAICPPAFGVTHQISHLYSG